jgi:hypothetical protein
MDIHAVAKASQIGVGAINVWQQRGLIPGIVSRGAGRRRLFDVDTAVYIGVMAVLTRMGIGPTPAAGIAAQCGKEQRYRLVMSEMPIILDSEVSFIDRKVEQELRETMRQVPATVGFDRLDQLDGYFADMFKIGGPPPAFTVIDVAAIRSKMQAIEDGLERTESADEP